MTDDQALIDEAVEMCDASEKSGRVTVAGLGIREVRSLVAALERALMDSKRLDWLNTEGWTTIEMRKGEAELCAGTRYTDVRAAIDRTMRLPSPWPCGCFEGNHCADPERPNCAMKAREVAGRTSY